MKQLNPDWANSDNGKKETKDWLENEHCASWLCDSEVWNLQYKTGECKYAIGAAPIEMWTKAYNAYVGKYETSDNKVNCGIKNTNGYGWGLNGGSLSTSQGISIDTSIEQSKVLVDHSSQQWLASPSTWGNRALCCVKRASCEYVNPNNKLKFCPVVSLNH